MKRLKVSSFVLCLSFFCLTACGNRQKIAEETQTTIATITQQLNDIQSLESDLQTAWENDIDTDSKLTSYAHEKGEVFDNIKKRQELFATLKQSMNTLKSQTSALEQIKDNKFPLSEIKIVTNYLKEITTNIDNYQKIAVPELEQERSFFKTLNTTELKYEYLSDKLSELNTLAMARQEALTPVIDPLVNVDKPLRIVKARVSNLSSTNQ